MPNTVGKKLQYQFPCVGSGDVQGLRQVLVDNTGVYFEGLRNGFNALYPRSISDLVGVEYTRLDDRMREFISYRNKIFHGQLTSVNLSHGDLVACVNDIEMWCKNLANGAFTEFCYDGFGWNSFQKSSIPELSKRFKVQIGSIAEYNAFVRQYMQRQ